MSKQTKDNLCIAFFLILVLFLPQTEVFARAYFVVLLAGVFLFLGSRKINLDWLSITGIGILCFIAGSTILRFAVVVKPNLRDYTELARFTLPVLMLIFRDRFKNLKLETVFIVFAVYCSFDFVVSILDFSNISSMGIVSFTRRYYMSESHAIATYRIMGLSPGPGQHGIMMLVFFIFFYIRTFQSKRILLPLFFSVITLIPLFFSQSRTSIVAFLVVAVGVPMFYLLRGNKKEKKRSIPLLGLILGGGSYLFFLYIDFFSRVLQLLKGVEQVSSFQSRQEHLALLIDKALEYPLFLLIGYGKEFFKTSVFDNEYMLMFLIHGPLLTLFLIAGILLFLLKTLLKENIYIYHSRIILFFLLFTGLIVAYPIQFFTKVAILPIIFVFINLTYWEKKKLCKR